MSYNSIDSQPKVASINTKEVEMTTTAPTTRTKKNTMQK